MSAAKSDRITTLHPAGKQGVRIERVKYDQMRRGLLRVIPRDDDGVAFRDLTDLVSDHLTQEVFPPETSVTWYLVTVKQDMEARGEIEIVPGSRPQRLRKTKGRRR